MTTLSGKEKQRTSSELCNRVAVFEFAAIFRILMVETGWDEGALLGVFRRGLRDEMKDELAEVPTRGIVS